MLYAGGDGDVLSRTFILIQGLLKTVYEANNRSNSSIPDSINPSQGLAMTGHRNASSSSHLVGATPKPDKISPTELIDEIIPPQPIQSLLVGAPIPKQPNVPPLRH
jgi:hypothetical protein